MLRPGGSTLDLLSQRRIIEAAEVALSEFPTLLDERRDQLALNSLPQDLEVVEAAPQAQMPRLVPLRTLAGGDGTRLQNAEGVVAQRPFHVLGAGEQRLGPQCLLEHRGQFLLPHGWRGRRFGRKRNKLDAVPGRLHGILSPGGMMAQDAAGGAVQPPAVRLNHAVHQPLVEAMDGLDDGLSGLLRVAAEAHPRGPSRNGLLYDDRHGTSRHVEAQLLAVEQRTIGPEGGPDETDVLHDGLRATHVHVRLVEPCVGRARGVLPRGRRADGHRHFTERPGDPAVNVPLHACGHRCAEKHAADAKRGVPHLLPAHVLKPLAVQFEQDPLPQARGADVLTVGFGGEHHGRGDTEARRGHQRESEPLPADLTRGSLSDLLEGQQPVHGCRCSSMTCWNRVTR